MGRYSPKTKKLVNIIDVIFYETSMIQVLAPKDSSVEIVHRSDKHVELEFETILVPNLDEFSVATALIPMQ